MYKYYCTRRPAMPGAIPTKGLDHITDMDPREIIEKIGTGAYALLVYNRPLTDDEVGNYELTPSEVKRETYKGYDIVWDYRDKMWRISEAGKVFPEIACTDTLEEAKEGIDGLEAIA